MVDWYIYAIVAAIFYLGSDLAVSLYYSSKYGDKEWAKVKAFGIFTKSLKNSMKNNYDSFRGKET